jgi:hypothetical protein
MNNVLAGICLQILPRIMIPRNRPDPLSLPATAAITL